jgi:hypothetical protein
VTTLFPTWQPRTAVSLEAPPTCAPVRAHGRLTTTSPTGLLLLSSPAWANLTGAVPAMSKELSPRLTNPLLTMDPRLTFTSGPVSGKKMVVQVTNTGGDLGDNHFDLQMPGGGVGLFNGCTTQFGAPSTGWGAQYGGISSRSQCDSFPEKLKAGCYWRFDWFKNADNPSVSFQPVTCPSALTDKTGCRRN